MATSREDGMVHMDRTEVRRRWRDTIRKVQCGGERIVLERQGRPVAALVSLEDLDLPEEIEDQYLDRLADAAEAEPGEDIWWEEVETDSGAFS